ncbi:hypothetical protein [Cellulomonas uda]|uniref:Right handed beta helix domain-containing protein n=1 Tax=Cellulomonas uda TaxID=1714 RepID=A0A4Y3K7Z6_CELUD|nr:hypothetical protein [Cellulomonas uda]NII67054.1 hypothetical protein [Cellulomonas uda]GEA80072.1 hypothetical protein CUD01_05160 [Cellulomonas uda]
MTFDPRASAHRVRRARAAALVGAPALVVATALVGAAGLAAPASAATPGTSGVVKVVGTGTPASCTPAALAYAVKSGGTVRFDCGPKNVTIALDRTLFVCNTTTCRHPWQDPKAKVVQQLVLDGGGKVTLSGQGARGILYANTCEESFGWIDSRCDTQTTPYVLVKDITFTRGDASRTPAGKASVGGGGGGGAIAMRGGRLTVQRATFRENRCVQQHPDAGGGAIRVVGQKESARVLESTFTDNACANGGAVSSLQAPLLIRDSTFTGNTATGSGASSGQGGNGGAVYFDGTRQSVTIERSTIQRNVAPEGGPGVFYVSNDRTGTLTITDSTVTKNTGARFWTHKFRSIFYLGKAFVRSGSTID